MQPNRIDEMRTGRAPRLDIGPPERHCEEAARAQAPEGVRLPQCVVTDRL
jgi:hypothetical protein